MAVTWISAQDLLTPSDPYAEVAAQYASWILYKLTGEKYPGIRTSTEWIGLRGTQPGLCETFTDHGDFTWVSEGGTYGSREVKLRGQPVVEVTSVNNGGVVLDPAQYHVVNHSTLVNVDGSAWNLSNGIAVTYRHGTKPPAAGIFAAIRLANELILAMAGDENCALPANIQSLTRQGISMQFIDPSAFIDKGQTGIFEVDLFIAAANPTKARKRAKVFGANIPRGERWT